MGASERLTRRQALRLGGSATAFVLVESWPNATQLSAASPRTMAAAPDVRALRAATGFSTPAVRTVRLVRPADQLDLLVEFFDVVISANTLTPGTSEPAVRLTFGAQHTVERMFSGSPITVPTTIISQLTGRTSQVVAPITSAMPLTFDALLNLLAQTLTVQTHEAAPDGGSTVLEIPAGLAVSPSATTRIDAATNAFTVDDTTEVWMAELIDASGGPVSLIAVDNLASGPDLVAAIPTSVDRDRLVTNTTTIAPIQAKQLRLTSSGAFARLVGDWPGATLTRYRQRVATGRDVKVEVETTGYLAPFGHRAAITSSAERIFTTDTSGKLVAAVRVRRFLAIVDPDVDLATRAYQRDLGRRNLWTSVRALADEHVEISLVPVADATGNIPATDDIKILATGGDLVIDYVATDRDGHEVYFSLPATFMAADQAHLSGAGSPTRRLINKWNDGSRDARRNVSLAGQRVAFALPVALGADQTSKDTFALRFDLASPEPSAPIGHFEAEGIPAFNSLMGSVTITDPSVGGTRPADAFGVTFHPRWIANGIDPANFDLAFLTLDVPQVGSIGAGLPTGSVAAIDVKAEIFNQTAGIGINLPSPTASIDPSDLLGDGSKLLGSILLTELLDAIPANLAVPGVHIPNTTITEDNGTVTIVYSFKPPLRSNELVGFRANPATQCCVTITTVVPPGGSPTVTTQTLVSDFTMVFPPGGVVDIVNIDFDRLEVLLDSAGTLTVDPKMSGWELGDDLSFLQPLFDLLSNLGATTVDLSADYLELDASIDLPSLGFGIVAIRNLHLEFGIDLPLDGGPLQLSAGLGSSQNQVEVVAGIFGGSFYVTLDLEFHRQDVDWRVEAGLSLFLNLGFDAVVVSASVRLRLGLSFVFNADENGNEIEVKGVVALEGQVSVLGLVEVSASISASLTYNTSTEIAVARGSIHWAVDTPLGGVDGSVPLGRTEIELGGGAPRAFARRSGPSPAVAARLRAGAAPDQFAATAGDTSHTSFGDLYTQAAWTEYANAFA